MEFQAVIAAVWSSFWEMRAGEPKMDPFVLGILGVLVGAAGAEFLRAKSPKLIAKVEDAAKRFVDSLCSSRSAGEQTTEQDSAQEQARGPAQDEQGKT